MNTAKRYYIIAGEASGDLHASNLMKAIKIKAPSTEFRFWGGDLMQQQGGTMVKHYRELAFMGFTEVLINIRTILKNLKTCKNDLLSYQPDALILVDYPGFNLKIAEFAKKNNIKVFYYISPKVWAWNKKRAWKIKKVVDKMFTIFPFETAFYKKYGLQVDFVGHPTLDAIESTKMTAIEEQQFRSKNNLSDQPIIALLPGSRKQEVNRILSEMLLIIPHFKDYQFVIAGAPSLTSNFYEPLIKGKAQLIFDQTYDLLKIANAALVTSGTATLETALFRVPQVVCYATSPITYHLAKYVIQVKYISLVNLIMDNLIVTELIQNELNTKNIITELNLILGKNRNKMLSDYDDLIQKLGNKGASEKTADLILKS